MHANESIRLFVSVVSDLRCLLAISDNHLEAFNYVGSPMFHPDVSCAHTMLTSMNSRVLVVRSRERARALGCGDGRR